MYWGCAAAFTQVRLFYKSSNLGRYSLYWGSAVAVSLCSYGNIHTIVRMMTGAVGYEQKGSINAFILHRVNENVRD